MLRNAIKRKPGYKRIVIIGLDNRIKEIYNKIEDVPAEYQDLPVWHSFLRDDGDLDIKLPI